MDEKAIGASVRGLLPGQKLFNRYKLTRLLGRGETGVVWLARDEQQDHDTALKFLPEAIAIDRAAIGDLRRKVRRAIDLVHPYIARIHDFQSDGRIAAFSVEFVAGKPLAAVRMDEPTRVIAVDKLGPWIKQICDALGYAHHKANVVHGDIKPVNLLLDNDNNLKVSDFGVAATFSEEDACIFKSGGSTGALAYLSPQQLSGATPAVTDDIYSLGATLYELLTSKPPFYEGDILQKVENEVPPSIANRRAELAIVDVTPVSPEWEETIAACLSKYASARPQIMSRVVERMGLSEGAPAPNFEIGAVAAKVDPKPKDADLITRLTNSPFQTLTKSPYTEAISQEVHRVTSSRGFKLRAIFYPSIIVACVVLSAAGYYFGIHLPEKKQKAGKAAAETVAWAQTKADNSYSATIIESPTDAVSKYVIRGRGFRESDFYQTASPVALMSEYAWTMAWGRDPAIVGQEITPKNGIPHMIVGVVKSSDKQKLGHDLLLPSRTIKNPKMALWLQVKLRSDGDERVDGKRGPTGFYRAMKAGDLEKVKAFLSVGVIPDQDIDDVPYLAELATPLAAAAKSGNMEIAKLLLSAGADVNKSYVEGYSPFGAALPEHQLDMVKLLLEHGADLKKDIRREMPLTLAIKSRNRELIELLLSAGADPNLGESDRNVLPPIIAAFRMGDRNLLERLVAAGGRLDLTFMYQKWQQPYTSLMAAAESGNVEFYEWVRSIGGQSGPLSGNAWTMAHTAAQGGNVEIMSAIIAQGSDINANHSDSGTPLHIAAKSNHKEVARWLLHSGADASIKDGNGLTALEVAQQEGATNVVSVIRQFLDSAVARTKIAEVISEPELVQQMEVMPATEKKSEIVATPQEHIPGPVNGQPWVMPYLNIRIVPISAGTFTMGNANRGSNDERPLTAVALTKPFWLGATEITQKQWTDVMGTTLQEQRVKINGVWPVRGEGDNNPMYFVSWHEAREYCEKVNELEKAAGRLPDGYEYTLPTEAQWEYAARAGATVNIPDNLDDVAWYSANSGDETKLVAQKLPNVWELYDMQGNVMEWCSDYYGIYPGGEVSNPTGSATGSLKIVRGGDWASSASGCRCSIRNKKLPDSRDNFLGFRIALSLVN